MIKKFQLILYIFICFNFINGQTIQLNEIVSSNGSIIYDEDGDTPDWIEIFNGSNQTVNLEGFTISDDYGDLNKWSFPSFELPSSEFLVLFASDKDRKNIVIQWDAVIDWGDNWSYWEGSSAPIESWHEPDVNVDFWETGPSGFGYGDGDDNTETSQIMSVFIRKNFQIADPSIISKVLFHLDYDDGYIAYINGIEFSRRNMGTPGTDVSYNENTTDLHEAQLYQNIFPERINIDLDQINLNAGENTIAIQVHNFGSNSSDLSCIPFLTFGYNSVQNETRDPNPSMELPNSFLHTNFKLNSSSDMILLSDPQENIIDSISFSNIPTDMSFGRQLESDFWSLFAEPTPLSTNNNPGFLGALEKPLFSLNSGFYINDQSLSIISENEMAEIRYTIDGTVPKSNSLLYSSPIPLSETKVIRARAFATGWFKSRVESKTYLFNQSSAEGLPTIFLTTDPNNFFDNDSGIYVMGNEASSNFPYFGANFWEDWERPIHFEILEEDNSGYSANAGVKIFGGWSRGQDQKSLSIFARSQYGQSVFDYPLFHNSEISNYESFVLRNSGNDWTSTMLRDGYITSLASKTDVDHQLFRPAIIYLNGEYWGIQNIREKVNEHFLSSHHDINPENIDLLDIQGTNPENIVHGTNIDYLNLLDYLNNNDISDPAVQSGIEGWIDINSFMQYQAFQIFIDNRDWPGNNIKFWRDHRTTGKWRWILYDTDFGFGIWDYGAFSFNTLAFALAPNGPDWPNPPWSTLMLRTLIENDHFQDTFINVYCDMLNNIFSSSYLTESLDSVKNIIEDHIQVHKERWPGSAQNWYYNISTMENFAMNRRSYAITHLRNKFNLPNLALLNLNINSNEEGYIKLNSLKIEDLEWSGYYFPTIPLEVEAIAKPGSQFVEWLEYPDSSASMLISISDPFTLTAIFEPADIDSSAIAINEINYNSSDDFDTGDWIELINYGENVADISNWTFKDDDDEHIYQFPEQTIINPNEYLIIARELELFTNYFPESQNILGPFDFGLGGGGDQIRIFNETGFLIDSLEYDDSDPWPTEPDGLGYTLELINPLYDNSLSESWTFSEGNGTPGAQNSSFLEIIQVSTIIPNKTQIMPAYPNPFNGKVVIPFQLSELTNNSILIYNILGQIIYEKSLKGFLPGKHKIVWHGQTKTGNNISTGIYFFKLRTDKTESIQKVIYLK